MNMAEDLILRKGGVTVKMSFTGHEDDIKAIQEEILEALKVELTVDTTYLSKKDE